MTMTVNKIKERDLDEVLLKKMFSHGAGINLDNILSSYLKKTDVLTESNIPASYTETLNKRIKNLQTQLTNLQSKYTSGDEYSSELNNKINTLSSNLDLLKKQVAGITASDGTSLTDAVSNNKNKIQQLTEQINTMQTDLNSSLEKIKSLPSTEKITSLDSRIEEVNNRFNTIKTELEDEFNNEYRHLDTPIAKSDLDNALQSTINKTEDLISRFSNASSNNQVLYGNQGQTVIFDGNGNPKAADIFHTDVIICNTEQEVQDNINDLNNNKDIINISSGTVYKINENYYENQSSSLRYISYAIAGVLDYNNSFVYNKDDSTFSVLMDGKFVTPKKNVFLKDITVQANASLKVARENVFKKTPIVFLIKDMQNDSRTKNKYINGEGVATVAYEDDGYTIFNDDNVSHDFRLFGED